MPALERPGVYSSHTMRTVGQNAREHGTRAAYGPRNPREIRARYLTYRALKILGRRLPGEPATHLEFSPPVRDDREFSDLCARVSCYLGDLDLPFYLPGPPFQARPELVPYMDPGLVRDPGWVRRRPPGRGYLLVHRLTPATLLRLLTYPGAGASVVDERVYQRTELSYWWARDRVAWPNYPSADVSLQRLRARAAGDNRAFILATGPSALDVDLSAVDAGVRITCNSAVRDTERLEAFRPTILAFTDPVFHFGPSRYAAAFRKDLLRAIEVCDPLLLCGSDWVSPLLNLLPELRERLAVIPFRTGGEWRWPTERNPTTRITGSVFTNLMLPIALMLADHVSVAGVDGRQPSENYFWQHGLQYSDDLMRTVFDAHPAFFRDVDYAGFYDQYCQELENFLSAAERQGKVIVGAAASWIPALQRRGAPQPQK